MNQQDDHGTATDMPTKTILVDTDVLIDFLRGHPKAALLIQSQPDCIALSSVVVAELYAGVRGDKELDILDAIVDVFRVIPTSKEIARLAGLYKREYFKSHGIGLADAILAATAEFEHAALLTLNTKHYPMISGLKPAYIKK
jgi:predicted nucleic acid-binding protein